MVILDINGEVLHDPDEAKGMIEVKTIQVTHKYVVDVEKKSHYETIREYPETGGKDVAEVIDTEEQGHWDTLDESGVAVKHYDGVISEDWPHEQEIADSWSYGVYKPYTADELLQMKKANADNAAASAKMAQLGNAIEILTRENAKNMSDEEIAQCSTLFDEWRPDGVYKAREVLRFNNSLYRVLGDTATMQDDRDMFINTPDKEVGLYGIIGEPVDGIYHWVQPLGSDDAYKKGAKIIHNDKTWVSNIDCNVWEPGVSGWNEIN